MAKILLVEDERVIQKIHSSKLQKLGHRVKIATTGAEALLMYRNDYQLMLLDCGLPDINGVEVAKLIRQHEKTYQLVRIPIVMITAYTADAELQQECQAAEINELVVKPIFADKQWKKLLQRWIKR